MVVLKKECEPVKGLEESPTLSSPLAIPAGLLQRHLPCPPEPPLLYLRQTFSYQLLEVLDQTSRLQRLGRSQRGNCRAVLMFVAKSVLICLLR